jgi:hypothetical protein
MVLAHVLRRGGGGGGLRNGLRRGWVLLLPPPLMCTLWWCSWRWGVSRSYQLQHWGTGDTTLSPLH